MKEDSRMQGVRDRVKERMTFLKLDQHELARKCGLPHQKYISDLLTGKLKKLPHYLWDLSVALGKSVRWIVTGEDEDTAKYVEFYVQYKALIEAFETADDRIKKSILLQLGLTATVEPNDQKKKTDRSQKTA